MDVEFLGDADFDGRQHGVPRRQKRCGRMGKNSVPGKT